MRIFRPEVERALETIAIIALIGAIVLPVGWGDDQRQQARTWHRTACVYRLRELARGTSFVVNIDNLRDACATLHQRGLDVEKRP